MKNEPPPQQRPRRMFRPPTRISINPLLVLVVINILLFVVTSFNVSAKLDYALNPQLVTEHPWILITSIFIHDDFLHIFFNMFALYIFGRILRKFIGDNSFLLLYFVAGIVGNLLFWAINLNDYVFSLGASGAIYGIAGALVVLIPRLKIALWGILPMPLWVFVLVFMVVLSFIGPGAASVAWEAHIGGLAAGLVFGYFFRRRLKFMLY